MGCSSNPNVDNIKKNNEIEDYDEKDNFYYFHIQRKNKKPLPPSKYSPEKNYDFDRDDERIGTINDEDNKDSKNNVDSQNDEDTSEKRNKGDLYRNKNKNNNNNSSNEENSKKDLSDDDDSLKGKKNDLDKKSKNKKGNKDEKKDGKNDEKNRENRKNRKNKKNKNGEYDSYDSNDDEDRDGNEDDDDYSYENMENYKNLFSDKGKKLPKYKLNDNDGTEDEKKNKDLKKSKINGITIVQNLKDYFPEDITKEEIKNLVFEAFGNSIVDDMSLYIPGQTVTFEQAIELSNYIYNIIKNKKNNNEQCLEDLNVKIDLVPLNKKLIKEKMFKGQDPSEKQIENVFQSYGGESNNIKVLTIEFQ